jgi:hypothetical protein
LPYLFLSPDWFGVSFNQKSVNFTHEICCGSIQNFPEINAMICIVWCQYVWCRLANIKHCPKKKRGNVFSLLDLFKKAAHKQFGGIECTTGWSIWRSIPMLDGFYGGNHHPIFLCHYLNIIQSVHNPSMTYSPIKNINLGLSENEAKPSKWPCSHGDLDHNPLELGIIQRKIKQKQTQKLGVYLYIYVYTIYII